MENNLEPTKGSEEEREKEIKQGQGILLMKRAKEKKKIPLMNLMSLQLMISSVMLCQIFLI